MSICELFIDRDEPSNLVDQLINDMKGIGEISAEGANGMGQLSAADFWSMDLPRFECQYI